MEEHVKIKFDFSYWINELINAGKVIEPEKYTTEHINKVKRAWQPQPLSILVTKVRDRRAEAKQLNPSTDQPQPTK